MTGVVHVVLFRFRGDTAGSTRAEVSRRFLALEDAQRDGRSYVRSIECGPNVSPEGHGHGYDVGFVVRFDSLDDRDYYLDEDADHLAFTAYVGPLVDDVLVYDITA